MASLEEEKIQIIKCKMSIYCNVNIEFYPQILLTNVAQELRKHQQKISTDFMKCLMNLTKVGFPLSMKVSSTK